MHYLGRYDQHNATIFVRNLELHKYGCAGFQAERERKKKESSKFELLWERARSPVLSLVVCLTSGERRVQLLVEEPLLPVLLLLSDIALCWLDAAQHGANSSYSDSADDHRNKPISFISTGQKQDLLDITVGLCADVIDVPRQERVAKK